MKKYMRCYGCEYFMLDMLSNVYEEGDPFCGLHGRARVDQEGPQIDLNHRGGCGFSPFGETDTRQLSIFENLE